MDSSSLYLWCNLCYNFTPLLKQLNYSLYSALKSPISLVIAILGSIFLLREKPSKYIYMGVGLYILAAVVTHQDTYK